MYFMSHKVGLDYVGLLGKLRRKVWIVSKIKSGFCTIYPFYLQRVTLQDK